MRLSLALGVLSFSLLSQATEIPDSENTKLLVKGVETTKLSEMDSLKSARITQPWSGYYWAFAKGVLGFRYRDPEMMRLHKNLASFRVMKRYAHDDDNSVSNYIWRGKVDELSPSEKYDLLVGDPDFSLTENSWEHGTDLLWRRLGLGAVPIWRGICHGWSPASFSTPRPVKPVIATARNGQKITFYPEDIKALSSLLWAKGSYQSTLIGKRCDKSGLVGCTGFNAGALHRLLVNRIGKNGQHFVLDMDPGAEVWNYPIFSYEYKYVHPLTRAEVATQAEATLSLSSLPEDHDLRKDRSDRARTIVGIKMKIYYPEMSDPQVLDYDQESLDVIKDATYDYDLELDYTGNIVGGEYKNKTRPNFAWAPNENSKPVSTADSKLRWSEGLYLSETALKNIQKASKEGQPMKQVVDHLVELSKE